MGVAVLSPRDCLKQSYSKQPLLSPPMRCAKNPTPGRANRKKRAPSAASSPPSRSVVDQKMPMKNLVMGQVKILKRGEELAKASPEPPKHENKKQDPDLGSTNRMGPDPESVPTQIRLTDAKSNKVSTFYAGSAFITSPPPSSLPLPAFFTKKSAVAANTDEATTDLRRILRLDF